MKRSVLLALVLMAISNLSFAGLAAAGHSNLGMAGAIGFENFASGFGGVAVVAYFSALTDLRFTAAQYALISAAASIVGRFVTGTTAGALIERFGYVQFYILTTIIALPGVALFWWMSRSGLVDRSIGSAGNAAATFRAGRVPAAAAPDGGAVGAMIVYLAMLAVQIVCIVDVIRNHRNQLWIMALIFLPGPSTIAYFVVEILPGLRGNRHVRTVRAKAVVALDPDREVRAARVCARSGGHRREPYPAGRCLRCARQI